MLEVCERLYSVCLGAFYQRVYNGTCLSAFRRIAKQPVLSSQGKGANCIFFQVVGDGNFSVVQICHKLPLLVYWTKIRTNNVIEWMNREIRRRTRVVGAFPDGNSALMLVCARLRHVAGTQWGSKKYMNMKHLEAMEQEPLAG